MITEKDYEVLYYKTPLQYRNWLDGDADPNKYDNIKKKFLLEDILTNITMSELIQYIIFFFKEKYPNTSILHQICIGWEKEDETIDAKVRKGIQKINFEYSEGVLNDFDVPKKYLKNLDFVFDKDMHPSLASIVKKSLGGKSFEEEIEGIFVVKDSPIERIATTINTLQITLDKSRYIDYSDV